MSRKNPATEFEALKLRMERGRPHPEDHPELLLRRSIKLRPEVFQQRSPARFNSDAHIRELMQVIRVGRMLDALVVWWDGRGWTCLDGHHRMAAYQRVPNIDAMVPVRVFVGSPDAALAFSARSNTRAKLQMSANEKGTAAWRLVVLSSGMSKTEQAEATTVSERQISYMRKAKGMLLLKGASLEALATLSWGQARLQAEGRQAVDWDNDEEDKRAEAMALTLRKALGPTAERQPELFAKAVEKFSPMLATALREYFSTPEDEPKEEATDF